MEGLAGPSRVEARDQPLDLPPAAIVDNVAEAAAHSRTPGGLARGVAAEAADEVGRFRDGGRVGKMDMIVQEEAPSLSRFPPR